MRASGSPTGASGAMKTPFDTLVRNLAAVTALFYVCGFLTTNSYLYRLGITDFSLLRTRFILTGVLTLTPLVLALIWGIYAAVDLDVFSRDGRLLRRGYLFVLGDVAIPFGIYFALFAWASENDPFTSAREAALLSIICALVAIAVLGALYCYRTWDRRPVSRMLHRGQPVSYERFSRQFGVPDVMVETMVIAVGITILLLFYIGYFGDRFYAAIPEQIGGGRPRTVQLLFGADAVAAVRQLGIPVDDEQFLSPPVHLLWQGESTYVIQLPGSSSRGVVQLDRGLVNGVVSSGRPTPLTGGGEP